MISRAAEITPKEGQTAAETPIKTQIQARMKTAKATVIPGQIIAAANQAKSKTENKKFWNFVAENSETNTPAELILYGDISSDNSWYDDEITPKQFDKELKELGDVDEITVRINSGGGDVFAANAIYTRLKDHKAKINVKIDGWAASAATVIAMAGDTIQIPPSGVFMIHNPKMGVMGYYSAAEFDKLSAELAVIKQSIINAYCRKTGKKDEEISNLMDFETWLDGEQAVESGFCTELMFDDVTTEVEDAKHIVVNSVQMNLKNYNNLPQKLKNQGEKAVELSKTAANMVFDCRNSGSFTNNQQQSQVKPQNKGGFEMEIKTVEELEAKYPDLVAQIRNAAITAERSRIQDIESVAPKGYEKITNAAKFEKPITKGDFAMQILAEQKRQAAEISANTDADVEDSGIKDVKPINNEAENGGAGKDNNPYLTAIDKMLPARKEG